MSGYYSTINVESAIKTREEAENIIKTKTINVTVVFPDGHGFVYETTNYTSEYEYIIGIVSTNANRTSISNDGSTISVTGYGETAYKVYTITYKYIVLM